MRLLTVCCCLLLTACGKDGDHAASDGGGPGSSGEVEDNPLDVSGAFFIGDTSRPAAGYELLRIDWSTGQTHSHLIAANGSVKIELKEFVEGRTYSFHLVRGDEKISDIDLSQVNAGLQSAFQYRGGYGFSLGDVIVPVNQFGLLAPPPSGVTANLGGGFSLTGGERARRLEGMTAPALAADLLVEPMLIVPRPEELYYGYLHPLDAADAATIKARYDGFSVRASEASKGSIVRIFNSRLNGWQVSARVLPSEFAEIQSTKSWLSSDYHLSQTGSEFAADILPGISLSGRILFFKLEGKNPPQKELLRVVYPGFAKPPVVDGLAINGDPMASVDYSDLEARNGLTNPFCHDSGAVQLRLAAPILGDGHAATGAYFDQIQILPEYYTQEAGVTKLIASALAAPYNADKAQAADGDYLRAWTAATKTLTMTVTTAVMDEETHILTLPEDLFPSTLGGKAVTRVKLRVLFNAKSHPGKSGSVYLFRKSC